MRCATWMRRWGVVAVVLAVSGQVIADDDGPSPGLLGRIFRMGGSGGTGTSQPATPTPSPSPLPYGGSYYNRTPTASNFGTTLPPGGRSAGQPTPPSATTPAPLSNFNGLPETPPVSSSGPGDRLTPRSRVSQAVTTADPLLTRFALGKSNDGSTFGMFLEIFADGTVVDSEGVHHVRAAELKPILESVNSGELYRLQGHCGAPSTDFIEYVHVVVYQRRLGRLQAHAFSYSGNPQGCDHAVRHLHQAIENLQTKISRPPSSASASSAAAAVGPAPAIPLTPGN